MGGVGKGIRTSAGLRLRDAGVFCALASRAKAEQARRFLNNIFLVMRGGVPPCVPD